MKAQTATAITAERCAREVMETVPSVMRFIRTEMRSHRASLLSVPRFRVRTFLSRTPRAPLSSVAEHLAVSRSTASAIVDRPVRGKLVRRTVYPQERRCVVLMLTPAGAQHHRRAREAAGGYMAKVLADLPAADLLQIAEGLPSLAARSRRSARGVVGDSGIGAPMQTLHALSPLC
jgi:DNA-binding MarR family transcriptional regulator